MAAVLTGGRVQGVAAAVPAGDDLLLAELEQRHHLLAELRDLGAGEVLGRGGGEQEHQPQLQTGRV